MQKQFCDGQHLRSIFSMVVAAFAFLTLNAWSADKPFTVVSYNVKNYLIDPVGTRKIKSEESRKALVRNLVEMNADVIAFQEMGGAKGLAELRSRLKVGGIDYPIAKVLYGHDKDIQLAVLSRIPVVRSVAHTNVSYLIGTQRLWVSRGFDETQFKSDSGYEFTLINVHLKSKRTVPHADCDEMRLHEARLLRNIIDQRLGKNPDLNLMIVGDLNDSPDSPSVKRVVSGGNPTLTDLKPLACNKENGNGADWTYYYAAKKSENRYDYFLVSPGMAKDLIREKTIIFSGEKFGLASDHRPIIATIAAKDR